MQSNGWTKKAQRQVRINAVRVGAITEAKTLRSKVSQERESK